MIDAKELRIGNILSVGLRSGNGRKQIRAIHVQDIVRIHEIPETSTFTYEAIEITEEWLLKFGFKKDNLGYFSLYYNEFKPYYLLYNPKNTHLEMCLNGATTAQCPMRYIHQIQNLYFAITQKELVI